MASATVAVGAAGEQMRVRVTEAAMTGTRDFHEDGTGTSDDLGRLETLSR